MRFNSDYIRQPTTTWRTRSLVVKSRFKRMRRACALYCNSISPFRPFLKLMLDIELNPGPNGSLKYSRVVQYTRTVTVRISYVSIRTDRTHQQQGYTFGKVCFTVRKSHLISGTLVEYFLGKSGYIRFVDLYGSNRSTKVVYGL